MHGLRGHPQTTWEHRHIEANERTAETPRKRHRFCAIFRPHHIASTHASVNENSIENNVFWPRDYLLEDVSEAEVWTYGYNADVIGGLFQANNQNSVSQHGRDLAVKLEREIENQASPRICDLRQNFLISHYRCRSSSWHIALAGLLLRTCVSSFRGKNDVSTLMRRRQSADLSFFSHAPN